MKANVRFVFRVLAGLVLAAIPSRAAGPIDAVVQVRGVVAPAQQQSIPPLRADYRIDSESTVEGQRYTFQLWGTIYLRRVGGDGLEMVNLEYLDAERSTPDRIDRLTGGEVYSYHPFTQYAQRIPATSLVKDKTRWGKYWLPLMAYLDPGAGLPDPATLSTTEVATPYGAGIGLVQDVDQIEEVGKLTRGARLEYWNTPGDPTFVVDGQGRVVGRVVRYVHHAKSSSATPPPARVNKITHAYLDEFQTIAGIELPRRLRYEVRLPRYDAPHFVATVMLEAVATDVAWPAAELARVPADALWLPAERPRIEDLPRADSLERKILAADFYFGTQQSELGAAAFAEVERRVRGKAPGSPYELAHLARLYPFVGRTRESFSLFMGTIVGLRRDRRAGAAGFETDEDFENTLVRYITEYAHFKAEVDSPRWDGSRQTREEEVAKYVMGESEQFHTPLAIARLAGRASHHYSQAGRYQAARAALDVAAARVSGDAAASTWIDAAGRRVERHAAERARAEAIRTKRERERALRLVIREARAEGNSARVAELETRLERMRSTP